MLKYLNLENHFSSLGEHSKCRTNMLELTKKILVKVSFDALLFQKELHKAIKWIKDQEEINRLHEWVITEFGHKYPTIISKVFSRSKSALNH